MKVGNSTLDLTSPVVMAILNVTPDSFYSASRRESDEQIRTAAAKALEEGASIIDIGGYSSRPGADDVSVEEEFGRVARGFEAVRELSASAVVSVDTFRSEVVRRAFDRFGSFIVNDISAGDLDADMVRTVAGTGLPYIAMHMRANPATMQQFTDYDDVTDEVKRFFAEKTNLLRQSGIRDIIIDPGFGFAKSTRQNYQLMGRLDELLEFGFPLLSGVSRKSMIYKVLNVEPADCLAGTCALNWESLSKGASILRAHDVREACDVIKLFNYYRDAYGE